MEYDKNINQKLEFGRTCSQKYILWQNGWRNKLHWLTTSVTIIHWETNAKSVVQQCPEKKHEKPWEKYLIKCWCIQTKVKIHLIFNSVTRCLQRRTTLNFTESYFRNQSKKIFNCTLCNNVFQWKQNLYKQMQNFHSSVEYDKKFPYCRLSNLHMKRYQSKNAV